MANRNRMPEPRYRTDWDSLYAAYASMPLRARNPIATAMNRQWDLLTSMREFFDFFLGSVKYSPDNIARDSYRTMLGDESPPITFPLFSLNATRKHEELKPGRGKLSTCGGKSMTEMDRELIREVSKETEVAIMEKRSLFDGNGMLILPSTRERDEVNAEVRRIIDSGEPFSLYSIRLEIKGRFGNGAVVHLSSLPKTVQWMLGSGKLEKAGKDGHFKLYRRSS